MIKIIQYKKELLKKKEMLLMNCILNKIIIIIKIFLNIQLCIIHNLNQKFMTHLLNSIKGIFDKKSIQKRK